MNLFLRSIFAVCAVMIVALHGIGGVSDSLAQAPQAPQVPGPNRKDVFIRDSSATKLAERTKIQSITQGGGAPVPGVDFQAPQIEFDRNKHEITGKGGVTISDSGVQVQADQGTFNTETRDGKVEGNVVVTSSTGVMLADSASLNVPSETGEFTNLEFEVEDGSFLVNSAKARKISEFDFELEDSSFTSCHCPDGAKPWELRTSSCSMTQEGYAHTYGSSFYFEGLPVFYAPYLALPIKNERASGLMPPQIGMSNQDGYMYKQPILAIVDNSTDLTISPFSQSRSRVGADLAFQREFSKTHSLKSGFLYSDESKRGNNRRGLDLTGTFDPTIDTNRTGGYWQQRWTPDPKEQIPVEFMVDGKYTSDNLMLREIPAPMIGDKQSQFLVSTAVLRAQILDVISTEGRAEYNQMLLTDQDVQTQRLPELTASTGTNFRPFGFNPYGLKLVTNAAVTTTNFYRGNAHGKDAQGNPAQGYDGWRTDMVPRAAVPFHIANYLKGSFSVELHETQYNTNSPQRPDQSYLIDPSISRTLPILGYGMSTGVERVFEVDRSSTFSRLVNLGAKNERSELVRLKHTIEPDVQYTYIPDKDQSNNPLYDSIDRFRNRSLVSYGLSSRLYGKFMEPYERLRDVEELTPVKQSVPMVDLGSSVLDFGRNMILSPAPNIDARVGEVRQLALFTVRQTYDMTDQNTPTPTPTPTDGGSGSDTKKDDSSPWDRFSDLGIGAGISPSQYLSSGVQTNYGLKDGKPHSYSLSLGLMDDRQDMIRARYNFIMDTDPGQVVDPKTKQIVEADNSTNQIEANIEFALHTRVRAGGYVIADTRKGEVIESRALLRFINSCRCWSADIGIGETRNPERKQALFTFTFGGLGGINQGIGLPTASSQQ